jgi:hypothetical protein
VALPSACRVVNVRSQTSATGRGKPTTLVVGGCHEASARSRCRRGAGRVAPVAPETSVETREFGCVSGLKWLPDVGSTAVVWQSGCVLAVRRIDTEEDCRREDISRGRLRAVASVTPSMKIGGGETSFGESVAANALCHACPPSERSPVRRHARLGRPFDCAVFGHADTV